MDLDTLISEVKKQIDLILIFILRNIEMFFTSNNNYEKTTNN